jgi:hypothetical protein
LISSCVEKLVGWLLLFCNTLKALQQSAFDSISLTLTLHCSMKNNMICLKRHSDGPGINEWKGTPKSVGLRWSQIDFPPGDVLNMNAVLLPTQVTMGNNTVTDDPTQKL